MSRHLLEIALLIFVVALFGNALLHGTASWLLLTVQALLAIAVTVVCAYSVSPRHGSVISSRSRLYRLIVKSLHHL